jgi:DNA (cytosine-5)-methyltransferase 1
MYNISLTGDVAATLNAASGGSANHSGPSVVCYGIDQQGGKGGANYTVDVAPTLASNSHGTPHGVCYGLDRASFNQGKNAKFDISIQEDIAQPIVARGPGGVMQTR